VHGIEVLISVIITWPVIEHPGAIIAWISGCVFISIRVVCHNSILIRVITGDGDIMTRGCQAVQEHKGIIIVDFSLDLGKAGRPVHGRRESMPGKIFGHVGFGILPVVLGDISITSISDSSIGISLSDIIGVAVVCINFRDIPAEIVRMGIRSAASHGMVWKDIIILDAHQGGRGSAGPVAIEPVCSVIDLVEIGHAEALDNICLDPDIFGCGQVFF